MVHCGASVSELYGVFVLRGYSHFVSSHLVNSILSTPFWSMLTRRELTKWELTKWEVDEVGRFTI